MVSWDMTYTSVLTVEIVYCSCSSSLHMVKCSMQKTSCCMIAAEASEGCRCRGFSESCLWLLDLVTVGSDEMQGSLQCWEMEDEECELFVKQRQQLIRRALKMFSLLQRMLSFKLGSCDLPSACPVLCSTLFSIVHVHRDQRFNSKHS